MIKQAHRLNAESSALRASYAQPPDISRSGRKAIRIASVVMLFVASDGTGYVEYEVRNVVNNVITSDNLYLQEIAPTDNNFQRRSSALPLRTKLYSPVRSFPMAREEFWRLGQFHHPVGRCLNIPIRQWTLLLAWWGHPTICRLARQQLNLGNPRQLCSEKAASLLLPTAPIPSTDRWSLLRLRQVADLPLSLRCFP
jgi:hypothetical protein